MKTKIFIMLALWTSLMIQPTVSAVEGVTVEKKLYTLALDAYMKGDYLTAKSKLNELLASSPNHASGKALLENVNADMSRSGFGGGGRSFGPSFGGSGGGIKEQRMSQRYAISQAKDNVRTARKRANSSNYKQVVDFLSDTQNNIPVNTATLNVHRGIQAEKIKIAANAVKSKRTADGREYLSGLLNEYQERYGDTGEFKKLKAKVDAVLNNPYYQDVKEVSPAWSEANDTVQELIVKARAKYLFGDLKGAQQTLNEAEIRDSNNNEVKGLQHIIANAMNKKGELDRRKTREQMIEEVNRSWQRPQVFEIKEKQDQDIVEDDPILIKLRNIIIPGFSISGTPLRDAAEALADLSRDFDSSAISEEDKGVSIVVKDQEDKNPTVNVKLHKCTLEEALQYVTNSVSFSFDVEDGLVIIRPAGQGIGLETDFFPISNAAIIIITGFSGNTESTLSSDPFSETVQTSAGPSALEKEKTLRDFFERAGVNFSGTPGSSLVYDGAGLIVRQTPRNMERLKAILRKYDETKQVEIEAKFLEVKEGALEEVGFQWALERAGRGSLQDTFSQDFFQTGNDLSDGSLANDGNSLRKLNEAFTLSSSTAGDGLISAQQEAKNVVNVVNTDESGIVTDVLSTTVDAFIPSIDISVPNSPPQFPNIINVGTGAVATSAWSTVLGGWQAQLTINALEQHTGSDLMSAPRVTVLANTRADIVVAQRLIYPTSYGDTEAEVDQSSGTQTTTTEARPSVAVTPGTPQEFETQNIGVELSVTPIVEDDDNITLELNPKVTEFEGFVEYGAPAVALAGGTAVTVPSGFYVPTFSTRELETTVTIFDGATIVLGGLTREEIRSTSDKVPVLGDIPMLGRLFRSEGETREKRNLLVFVSANLVSPGGSPSKQSYRTVKANSLFQNPVIVTPGGAVQRNVRETGTK